MTTFSTFYSLLSTFSRSACSRCALSRSAWRFVAVSGLLAVGSLLLAGWMPITFSIATVFLFAGPHNWLEARYFLRRMPPRWGHQRSYYLLAIAGLVGLMTAFVALPSMARLLSGWGWTEGWAVAIGSWNTLLIGWAALLFQRCQRMLHRPVPSWIWPVALAATGVNWLYPFAWSAALVYLHPLVAFWFLGRELQRKRPEWLGAYRMCLACLPALLGILWWRLASAPDLVEADVLTSQIVNHAGAGVLTHVSTHLLVATHTFLEMLHYGVWVFAIPLVGIRTYPWRIDSIPLCHRSRGWRTAVVGMLACGAVVVVALWGAFLVDYGWTRDVYFTLALLHVLAEFPMLIRLR